MQDYELDAWLGDIEAADEQRARLYAAADAIATRYPGEDLADTREQAFSAAAAVILGDDSLETIANQWRAARRLEQERHAALTGALIASEGSEIALADRAGVTRMTVRKALGK